MKFLLLLFLTSVTHASTSRLSVFGTQPVFNSTAGALTRSSSTALASGSLWLEDETNLLYNPALLNNYKNFVLLDRMHEFGVFKNISNYFDIGVYLNRGGSLLNSKKRGPFVMKPQNTYSPGFVAPGFRETALNGSTEGSILQTSMPVELMLAGDYGINWGLHYLHSENASSKFNHVNLGFQFLMLETFFGSTFLSQIENSKNILDSNIGVQSLNEWNAGLKIKYESWSSYFSYKNFFETGTSTVRTTQASTTMNTVGFGVAHTKDLTPQFHFIHHLGLFVNKVKNNEIYKNFTQTTLPINLGFESDMSENLILRSGATFEIINYVNNNLPKPKFSPDLNVGGTYNFLQFLKGTSLDLVMGKAKATNDQFKSEYYFMSSVKYSWDQINYKL